MKTRLMRSQSWVKPKKKVLVSRYGGLGLSEAQF